MSQASPPITRPEPRRGQVWWVQFPNRPNDPHLPRPAIVISNDKRNQFDRSVLAIPVSAEEGHRKQLLPSHVPLKKGSGGLGKDSRAMCEQIASIDKSNCKTQIGSLPAATLSLLVTAIHKAIE